MKLNLKKQEHLTDQLSKDYDLLKQLENSHRLTSDPKEKAKLKLDIETLQEEIQLHSSELNSSQTNSTETAFLTEQTNVNFLTVPEVSYVTSTEVQVLKPIITGDFFEHLPPPLIIDFVGRKNIIEDINAKKDKIHFVIITGITGTGKTALLRQFSSSLNQYSIFWYKFRSGFITLEDVLMHLARFLDKNNQINFFEKALRVAGNSIQDKITLIIKELNRVRSFLFFDDFHLVEENTELESFFTLLKEQLKSGKIFVSSLLRPNFIHPKDLTDGNLRLIHLEGLNEDEIKELFSKKGIEISQDGVEKINNLIDGMPLAIDLLISLAGENLTEENLIEISENVQGQVIEHLYDALYRKLTDSEKNLLVVAAILNLPFTKSNSIQLNQKIFDENAVVEFSSLRKKSLVIEIGNGYFKIPDILRSLVLTHTKLKIREISSNLAEHLLEIAPDDYYAHLDAFLLYQKLEDWNQVADIISELINRHMSVYEPELAEKLLDKLEKDKFNAEKWIWILADKGNIATNLRQFEKAEAIYKSMLDLAKEQNNKEGESLALQRLGAFYVEKGDVTKAEIFYKDSLKLKVKLKDSNGQSEIHNNLGLIYSAKEDWELALNEYKKGLKLRNKENDPEWEYLALYSNLGILYAKNKKWDKAFEFSHKALKIAEELKSPYDISKSIYNLGLHNLEQGHIEKAKEELLEVFDIAKDYDLDEVKELACIALGQLYYEINEFEEAIYYFEQVAAIYQKYDQKEGLCQIKFDIGTFYVSCDKFAKAIEYYIEGIELFENLNDKSQIKIHLQNISILVLKLETKKEKLSLIESLKELKRKLCNQAISYKLSLIYRTLGDVYLEALGKERVAAACFRQEINLLEQLNCKRELVASLMRLSNIYEDEESFYKVLEFLGKASKISEDNNFSDLLDGIYYNTGNIYAEIEYYDEAEETYRKAEDIALKEKNYNLLNMIRHNLGEIYRRQGQVENALDLLQDTLTFNREQNKIEDIVFNLNSLGLAYEQLGKETEALTYWHEAVSLAHSHNLYHEESNALISIGNFYWEKDDFLQAKHHYEQSLKVAQDNQDINMEESAMLSLADAHRVLGTISEIEKDFTKVAERADELKNYENLCKFLALAGAINLEEGEAEESAKMFDQSLFLAYWRLLNFWSQFPSEQKLPIKVLEFPYIFSRAKSSVEYVIENNNLEVAREMYKSLKNKLKDRKFIDSFNFIEDILDDIFKVLKIN